MVVVQMIKETACLSVPVHRCTKLWGPCPCGHGPRPCTCVQGPKKSPPQLMSCPQRASPQVQLWEHNCLLHDGNCGTRTTCTTGTSITVSTGNCGISMVNKTMGISLCVATGKMTTCGIRTNCVTEASITLYTCNWESQWSDEQSGPCEKTSASRQGSTKSAKMFSLLIPAMMPSIMGLPNREKTHREV